LTAAAWCPPAISGAQHEDRALPAPGVHARAFLKLLRQRNRPQPRWRQRRVRCREGEIARVRPAGPGSRPAMIYRVPLGTAVATSARLSPAPSRPLPARSPLAGVSGSWRAAVGTAQRQIPASLTLKLYSLSKAPLAEDCRSCAFLPFYAPASLWAAKPHWKTA
jgi:hypothetical protein